MARWVRTNRCVRAVALDWQTYSGLPVFRQQLAGLIAFDRLTGQRLHYLINGPAQESRYLALFRAVPPSRIALTNAKAPVAKPRSGPPATWGARYGAAYRARVREDLVMLAAARATS
jgi:hypothetical protein